MYIVVICIRCGVRPFCVLALQLLIAIPLSLVLASGCFAFVTVTGVIFTSAA